MENLRAVRHANGHLVYSEAFFFCTEIYACFLSVSQLFVTAAHIQYMLNIRWSVVVCKLHSNSAIGELK